MQKAANAKKGFSVPHILLIIGGIILLSCLCTYIAPTGAFDMDESGRVIPGTFHAVERVGISPWQALLMVMEGIQNASSIIAMMLVAGGSIECVIATGAFTDILNFGIYKLKDKSVTVLVPSIVVLMSAIGAFAAQDSLIAFVTVGILICKRLKLDRITAMAMFYLGYLIGQAASFTSSMVIIFQGYAEVRPLSGMGVRMFIWVIFTTVNAIYCTRYALMISKDPSKSYMGEVLLPDEDMEEVKNAGFPLRGLLTVVGMFGIFIFYAVCGSIYGWGVEHLIALFIIMAILVSVIYAVNPNDASKSFFKGACSMGGICLVMGLARVVGFILERGHIMHTLAYGVSELIGGSGLAVAGIGIFIFTLFLNLLIPSGTSKAAIMMPVLVPIGDVCGLTRQCVALAYQLGDGMTNTLTPMSGPLIGSLGLADVEYSQWFRYAAPLMLILSGISAVFICVLSTISWMG